MLLDDGPGLFATPDELGGATVADALLAPTVIYVRAALDLLRSGVAVHGLAHITGGGLKNLLRLGTGVGYAIEEPLAVPPICALVARLGAIPEAEMWEVFNMGCGFVATVPETACGRSGGDPRGAASGRPADRHRHGRNRRRDGARRPEARLISVAAPTV